MLKSQKTYDSHAWTGEEDYVEVEAIPIVVILGGLAMLVVALMI